MASDQKNIDHFNRTANDPGLWKLRGLDLHTSATVLREAAIKGMKAPDWSNLKFDDPGVADCLKYAGVIFQAAMLQGFAIECLLKGFYVAKGNKVAEDGKYKIDSIQRENHDLVAVASGVGFPLSSDEAAALAKLSLFARSFGRYPIAKKWQEQKLTKNEHGIEARLSWDDAEHNLAEAVLVRLKAEIETALTAGAL
jgi:hypothetical protein